MRIRLISLFSLFSIALAGCGASQVKATDLPNLSPPDQKENESLSTPSPDTPTQEDKMPNDSLLPTPSTQWDDMPKDPPLTFPRTPGPIVSIENAKADLAQRLSVSASQIKTLETKEVVWPDASLGCPQPGTVYAQIPTPGYLVILEHAGNEYEYHVGSHGNALYCKNPTPPISGTPADSYPFPTLVP